MQGNKLTVFLTMIVTGVLSMFVVVCTCYIGIIFVYPFYGVMGAVIYLLATGQPLLNPKTGRG